jgi:hypothetical protein
MRIRIAARRPGPRRDETETALTRWTTSDARTTSEAASRKVKDHGLGLQEHVCVRGNRRPSFPHPGEEQCPVLEVEKEKKERRRLLGSWFCDGPKASFAGRNLGRLAAILAEFARRAEGLRKEAVAAITRAGAGMAAAHHHRAGGHLSNHPSSRRPDARGAEEILPRIWQH